MKKKYKDMTPEEQRKENIRLAKRDSRQALIISLAAMGVIIIRIILRAILQLQ